MITTNRRTTSLALAGIFIAASGCVTPQHAPQRDGEELVAVVVGTNGISGNFYRRFPQGRALLTAPGATRSERTATLLREKGQLSRQALRSAEIAQLGSYAQALQRISEGPPPSHWVQYWVVTIGSKGSRHEHGLSDGPFINWLIGLRASPPPKGATTRQATRWKTSLPN